MTDTSNNQTSHDTVCRRPTSSPTRGPVGAARSGADDALRQRAVDLQEAADAHHYTYTWEWLGVPIIRLPDDVMVLQELFWSYRPQRVVETGVARGGSMLLDASLHAADRRGAGRARHRPEDLPAHPRRAGRPPGWPRASSCSRATRRWRLAGDRTQAFLGDAERAVLILDSNHTHDHVLAELRLLAPLLPVGGLVLVADTLVEEFPAGFYPDRPWDKGNNPLTAVRAFLAENADFEPAPDWSRRALVTEFRDGIIRRVR